MSITKNLKEFGGKSEATFDNSEAFAAAFDFFSQNKGGELVISAGTWRTGPIDLCSGMTLTLEENAVVQFIAEPARYRPVKTRWEGVVCHAMHPCIFAANATDVTIRGKGTFDGNGSFWWAEKRRKKTQTGPVEPFELELAALNPGYEKQPGGGGGRETQFLRPSLMQFYECENVKVEGITLKNSPFWTFHPVFTKNLTVEGISISNPEDAPNTDGMDIDSCENVVIRNCNVSVGDDGIAIKAGAGEDGIRINRKSRHITVDRCTVTKGHGGIVLGSETAAGIEDVTVTDCTFCGTDRGIRLKTRRGRGGTVHNLHFDGLKITDCLCPFAINMFYCCGTKRCEPEFFSQEALPVNEATPHLTDITIRNVHATGCKASAGFIAALPEAPLTNLIIQNCVFETDESAPEKPDLSDMFSGIPETSEKSFRILHAENPVFENVSIIGPKEAFLLH